MAKWTLKHNVITSEMWLKWLIERKHLGNVFRCWLDVFKCVAVAVAQAFPLNILMFRALYIHLFFLRHELSNYRLIAYYFVVNIVVNVETENSLN